MKQIVYSICFISFMRELSCHLGGDLKNLIGAQFKNKNSISITVMNLYIQLINI